MKRTLRVLQLGSPTGLYGAERWILALIKHLNPQKIESLVGVIKDDPDLDVPLCKEASKLGFKTICFEAQGKVNFSAIKQVKNFILQEKIDILHTHFYKTDIIGFWATRGTACKVIATPHGWSTEVDFKLWLFESLDRVIFPFMDAVVPLSKELYKPLKRMPYLKNKLHFIRNGVDLSEIIQSKTANAEILTKRKNGKFILGYIGQLISRKGLDTLFDALIRINDIPWELYLIGDGPQWEELEQIANRLKIKDRVHFMGFRTDRLDFLRGFDTFVLPSRLEGIPRCLMESMAARVPIIASDIAGSNDLITDFKTGLLFPLDCPEILSQKITLIASDTGLKNDLVQNAFDFINQSFSAQRMATEYETLFEKIIV